MPKGPVSVHKEAYLTAVLTGRKGPSEGAKTGVKDTVEEGYR
jgi:hypothetical protein